MPAVTTADAGPRTRSIVPTASSVVERRWLLALGWLTAAVGALTSGLGLELSAAADPVEVLSVRGNAVLLYGDGLYRYDSLFLGAGNRGTDLVTLLLGVPLMVTCLIGIARGSARAQALLPGAFGWFLYVYATMTVATAYNSLFGAYVLLFAASLFGGALAVRAVDAEALVASARGLPRRLAGWLMVVSGILTPVIWLGPLLATQLAGDEPDRLDTSTTFVTQGLDSAIIAPLALLAGVLILRGRGLGYVIAIPLLVIEAWLAPTMAAQTSFQLSAGIEFTPAEVVGPFGGFTVLSIVAIVALVRVVRAVR